MAISSLIYLKQIEWLAHILQDTPTCILDHSKDLTPIKPIIENMNFDLFHLRSCKNGEIYTRISLVNRLKSHDILIIVTFFLTGKILKNFIYLYKYIWMYFLF